MHLYHWQVWCIYADIGCSCCQLSEDREFWSSQPQSNPIWKARQSWQMHRLISICKKYEVKKVPVLNLPCKNANNKKLKKFGHWSFPMFVLGRLLIHPLRIQVWLIFLSKVESSRQCGNIQEFLSGSHIPPSEPHNFGVDRFKVERMWKDTSEQFPLISGPAKDPEHFPKWDVESAALSWVFWMKSDEYKSCVGLLSALYINTGSLELKK